MLGHQNFIHIRQNDDPYESIQYYFAIVISPIVRLLEISIVGRERKNFHVRIATRCRLDNHLMGADEILMWWKHVYGILTHGDVKRFVLWDLVIICYPACLLSGSLFRFAYSIFGPLGKRFRFIGEIVLDV